MRVCQISLLARAHDRVSYMQAKSNIFLFGEKFLITTLLSLKTKLKSRFPELFMNSPLPESIKPINIEREYANIKICYVFGGKSVYHLS